jgi:hypothetical protein
MDNLNGFKVFNCYNYVHCRGYPDIARCTVLAETAEVAIGLALEEYPNMPADNWEVEEVKLNGSSQILFSSYESH